MVGTDPMGGAGVSPARIGRPTTRCCPTPARSLIRSMWCGWPTTASTRCAAAPNRKPWDTGGGEEIPCIRSGGCSPLLRNGSTPAAKPACGASSTPETPTAKSGRPGTPRKQSAVSTTSTNPTLPTGTAGSSLPTFSTSPARRRSTSSAGPSPAGAAQITNWHHARYTNAATEAVNNLIKRIKRIGFGFRNFANYRIRALLYAGKPNWKLLPTLTPP